MNAERYPSAEFNLWLDYKQITPLDRFFLDSHRYAFGVGNVQVRNLRDIFKYDNAPGFDIDSNIALYARADCARILVLDHLLQQNPEQTAIYTDVDCQDVCLNAEPIVAALDQHGLVYGRSGDHLVCNGYIALRGARGRDFLENNLLPKTITAFQKNLVNHFGAFSDAIKDYRKQHGHKTRLGLVELPIMRTHMPYDESIYARVSPKSVTRAPGSRDLV